MIVLNALHVVRSLKLVNIGDEPDAEAAEPSPLKSRNMAYYTILILHLLREVSHKCFLKNATDFSNAPSFPAFTLGSLKLPLTAKPCSHPSQYSLSYPGANFPPPRSSSAFAWASSGNCESTVQEFMRRGALEDARYFCPMPRF